MDDLDRSISLREGGLPESVHHRLSSASGREARIQGALDIIRSESQMHYSLTRSLSVEEGDELEGKAGDTGMARDSTDSTDFSGKPVSAVSAGSLEGELKSPLDARVAPISRTPSPPRIVVQAKPEKLPNSLELVSVLAHLTTFGILGVLIRYLLEVLFENVAKLTSNTSALFIDLPANMLGSFFMGWVGVVFKKDIGIFSEHLAVGLSTGLMGSITTYAAMMQRNLALIVTGRWVIGLAGLLIGMYMAQMSLIVGEDVALVLRRMIERVNEERNQKGLEKWGMPEPDSRKRKMLGLALFLFLGVGLWVAAIILTMLDSKNTSRRTLWLACWVAPPGVWIRWYCVRLNGPGIGTGHYLRWFPFGTFLVNVTASSLEAGLSAVETGAGKYLATLMVGAINLGTLGCLSTVSTFVVEIQIMHEGNNALRAYIYPIFSMALSLVIGILVYGVPVWTKEV